MKVLGEEIDYAVLDILNNRIAKGNVTTRDVEALAKTHGIKHSLTLAMRLIQAAKKAHRIHRLPCSFIWKAGEAP
jgi:hypothetical protein